MYNWKRQKRLGKIGKGRPHDHPSRYLILHMTARRRNRNNPIVINELSNRYKISYKSGETKSLSKPGDILPTVEIGRVLLSKVCKLRGPVYGLRLLSYRG